MKDYRKAGARQRNVSGWAGMGVLSLVLMLTPAAGFAQEAANLVKNGGAEAGTLDNWHNFSKVVSEAPHSGKFCFLRQGDAMVSSRELIPIDPSKTYVLTGWFKSVGKKPSRIYLGCFLYDARKTRICPHEVQCIAGTETTLVEACKKEDTVLKIADGAKWTTKGRSCVAFEVDDSGNYADLPNRKTTNFGITKIENKGDHWEVHLAKKCNLAYPAGTKVRKHVGGSWMYSAAAAANVPAKWTQYTGPIKGVATQGAPTGQWWPGTKYVRILLLANHGPTGKDAELLVDDISMTISDE